MKSRSFLEQYYLLKQNPFASRTDPHVDMAGRKNEEQLWTKIVNSRKGTNANAIHFIVGDYGFGKTLSLFKIVSQYENDAEILPIFMKMLPEDRVSKFGVDFIQRIFQKIKPEIFSKFNDQDIASLKKIYPDCGKVFSRIKSGGVDGIEFLQGQRTFTLPQLQNIGIRRKMDKTDIAKEYLISFLFLLKGVGISTLLLAVDEVEYIFSQMRGSSIALVFNTLREFYDLPTQPAMSPLPSSPANVIFFFGISSSGWRYLTDLGRREQTQGGPIQPFTRRFGEPIELTPLNSEETKELIERRLRNNRSSGIIEDEPLIPYDDTFVNYVFELSLGNPGDIVKFCDYALEEGLIEKVKTLDKSFAEKAFISHGLITPPESA